MRILNSSLDLVALNNRIVECMQDPANHDDVEEALCIASFSACAAKTALKYLFVKEGIIPVSNKERQSEIFYLANTIEIHICATNIPEADQERRIRDLHALLS